MNKLNIALIVGLISICFCTNVQAQNIQEVMNDNSLNYFEKVDQIENSGLKAGSTDDAELKRYTRWRTFWDGRVDANGSTTTLYKEYSRIYEEALPASDPTLPQWEFAGPTEMSTKKNNMGRMESVAIHPTNNNIVYAGSSSGGLWRTTNALVSDPTQVHWECLTDNYFGMGVYDIAINPTNPNIIYIVTSIYANGLLRRDTYSLGIYKSTNAGTSWSRIMPVDPANAIEIRQIEIDHNNPNIVYAAGENKVYKTTNAGTSWTTHQVTSNSIAITSLVLNQDSPTKIYCSGSTGLYVSTTSGTSWTIATGYNSRALVKIDYSYVENALYAVDYSNRELQKSTDDGTTWSLVKSAVSSLATYIQALKIDVDGNIFVGGVSIYEMPYTTSIPNFQEKMHSDIRDLAFVNNSGTTLGFIATDGGVVRNTTEVDDEWESINGDLCVSQIYSVGTIDSDPSMQIIGAHDAGSMRHKDGAWKWVRGGDGGTSIIDYSNSARVGTTSGTGSGYFKTSTDYGISYNSASLYLHYRVIKVYAC